MLHITNGGATLRLMGPAGLPGEFLPWQDVLHEGPVPARLGLDALSEVRARYLADCGWGDYPRVLADFRHRDQRLKRFTEHAEVVLWFEHDLYDQLQILQILDWFSDQRMGERKLTMICIGEYPGIEDFYGLGQLSPGQLASLFGGRHTVNRDTLDLARRGWAAFRSSDPTALEALLGQDTSALPFLSAALQRHLEEFPAVAQGLSRTERQCLEAVAEGEKRPVELFRACQVREQSPFMGDWSFWRWLAQLGRGPAPALETVTGEGFVFPPTITPDGAFRAQRLRLTQTGRAVLDRRQDWLAIHPVDRWLGGVHLEENNLWRWNGAARHLEQDTRPA